MYMVLLSDLTVFFKVAINLVFAFLMSLKENGMQQYKASSASEIIIPVKNPDNLYFLKKCQNCTRQLFSKQLGVCRVYEE